MNQCQEDRFLSDVENHQMTVIRTDGVDRHLRFRAPGTICYGYDLITWPGHLCITGDCGTYVFQRVEDMFEFFRTDARYTKSKLPINQSYWGEKLLSVGTNAGYKEYSEDTFIAVIKSYFEDWDDCEEKRACWAEVESEVLCHSCDEHQAYHAAYSFEHDGFQFQDFFEHSFTEYTFHYTWCLHAIVWGITQYDESNKTEVAA